MMCNSLLIVKGYALCTYNISALWKLEFSDRLAGNCSLQRCKYRDIMSLYTVTMTKLAKLVFRCPVAPFIIMNGTAL